MKASLLVSHWQLDPSVLVPLSAVAVLYVLAAARLRGRWPRRRIASFLAGLGCLVVALQSGIDAYDDRLLSVHMVQHMLILLLAPLLLLAGRPVVLALAAIPPERRAGPARVLARTRGLGSPAWALAIFSGVVVFTHLPGFYDAAVRHASIHYAEHALYVLAGLLMWSPLVDGDPAPRHRLSGLGRLIYLIVAMLPMALVGAYLNRHATLVYPAYGPPAHALGVSAVDDQGQAGAIMWVVGDVIMVVVGLWAALAAMLAEERRLIAREARSAPIARGEGRTAG
ncbi:MAG: cytochrome c oxidase assembly protein [Solirubrobacteraceae bacterium]